MKRICLLVLAAVMLSSCASFRSGGSVPRRVETAAQRSGTVSASVAVNIHGVPQYPAEWFLKMVADDLTKTAAFDTAVLVEPLEIGRRDYHVDVNVDISEDGNVARNESNLYFSQSSLGLIPCFIKQHYKTTLTLKDHAGAVLWTGEYRNDARLASFLPVLPLGLIPTFWPSRVGDTAVRNTFRRALNDMTKTINDMRASGKWPAPQPATANGVSLKRESQGNGFIVARPGGDWKARHSSDGRRMLWGRNDGAYDTVTANVWTDYTPAFASDADFAEFVKKRMDDNDNPGRFTLLSSSAAVTSTGGHRNVLHEAVWNDAFPAKPFHKQAMVLRMKTRFFRHPDDERYLVCVQYSTRTLKPIPDADFNKDADAFIDSLRFTKPTKEDPARP